jgi:hypothetical protein
MESSSGERGHRPPTHPPSSSSRADDEPIDRAIDVATHRLTDAQEEFVEIGPGGARLDQADKVVRRAEDLELLAEEGHYDARRKLDEAGA